MNDKTITILQIYSHDMNIYGDWGNVLTVKRRLEWHGYKAKVIEYNPGDTFPANVDIVIGGGGQDAGQDKIQDDLLAIKTKLHDLANDGVPMLVICGLYQLFGKFFKLDISSKESAFLTSRHMPGPNDSLAI
jgi:CobQ-like glutamine amidotransferase family enzyme